ncbi:MAG: DUF835 domain-containing protein, partial [Candidatus Hydrothermarchaeota archaeon]
KAYGVFFDYVTSGRCGLVITRTKPNKVRKTYGLEKTPILWLTEMKIKDEMTVGLNLHEISMAISGFITHAACQGPIILLDGLEYLITNIGFTSVLRFLQIQRDRVSKRNTNLIVPLDFEALDKKELALLETELRILEN